MGVRTLKIFTALALSLASTPVFAASWQEVAHPADAACRAHHAGANAGILSRRRRAVRTKRHQGSAKAPAAHLPP